MYEKVKTSLTIEKISEDHCYRLLISNSLADQAIAFEDLSLDAILDLIYHHLYQMEDSSPADSQVIPEPWVKNLLSANTQSVNVHCQDLERLSFTSPVKKSPIQSILIRQFGRFLEKDICLKANTSFALDVRLLLPANTSSENSDAAVYWLQVLIKAAGTQTIVTVNEIAESWPAGLGESEMKILMPGLPEGNFIIHLSAILPFAQVSAQHELLITVTN